MGKSGSSTHYNTFELLIDAWMFGNISGCDELYVLSLFVFDVRAN